MSISEASMIIFYRFSFYPFIYPIDFRLIIQGKINYQDFAEIRDLRF